MSSMAASVLEFGKLRVSTADARQVLDRSFDSLGEAGGERVLEELAAAAWPNLAAA
jgi:hypothetical protein